MDFNNKVVLITGLSLSVAEKHAFPPSLPSAGSSSGIGEATALKFASLGAVVVITGRDAHKMASVAHKCRHVSAKEVLEVESDLTQESDAAALVETTIGRFGRLDVLVTNEGAVVYHSATDPNLLALFDAAFESGVRAVLRLIALCVPHLQRTKGSVVNVSSSAANKPVCVTCY